LALIFSFTGTALETALDVLDSFSYLVQETENSKAHQLGETGKPELVRSVFFIEDCRQGHGAIQHHF
jgi:hypothetical protein